MSTLTTKRANTASLRTHNSHLLLRLLRDMQPSSAKMLMERTGLQASTISRLLHSMADRDLVASRGTVQPDRSGGRPTEMWGLNGHFGASIGIYLASNVVVGVALDLNGAILETCVIPFRDPARHTADSLRGMISQAMGRLAHSETVASYPLIGVGVAAMGLVDRERATVRYFDARISLRELLPPNCEALHVENDANAVARGGLLGGAGSKGPVTNGVVLYAHEGIGAGLILNGALHLGAGGAAGEVGYRHCQLIPNPLEERSPASVEQFYAGVCGLVNLLNPEVVLLTGDLHGLDPEIVDELRRRLIADSNPVAREVQIRVAPCDPMDVARHIATIVLDEEIFDAAPMLEPASRTTGKESPR